MNKKGILLAELLSVIVVLTIIFVILVTTFFTIVNESKATLGVSQYEIFVNAAKLYVTTTLTDNKLVEVSLNDLIQADFLDNTIFIDPNSGDVINNNSSVIVDFNNQYFKFVPYYSNDGLLLNIDSYKPITNFCNNIICLDGIYNKDDKQYELNEIGINLSKYEHYTISFYMLIENEDSNSNFEHYNDFIMINDTNIPVNTINEYTSYDIIKENNNLIIYIDGNRVYNSSITSYIGSILLENTYLVKNIRFYNKSLTRDEIVTNYYISKERFSR